MQSSCRVVDRKHRDIVRERVRLAVRVRDRDRREEVPERMAPERDDDLRLDDGDLHLEPGHALGFFLRRGVAIARRSKLHDVGNVDFLPLQTDGIQEFIQKLARGTDEGPTELIFLFSRGLANEHDLCLGVPLSEYGIRRFCQITALPFLQFFAELRECHRHASIVAGLQNVRHQLCANYQEKPDDLDPLLFAPLFEVRIPSDQNFSASVLRILGAYP